MKTIGLLGGMSWQSTAAYYDAINRQVSQRLGGLHSARILLYSVDFHELADLQEAGLWDRAGLLLGDAGAALKRGGAEFLVLCTNTMHKMAREIEARAGIPLLHIADATGRAVREAGLRHVGLLGTRFTMEQDFYRGRLEGEYGLRVSIPPADSRETIHRVIYEELCRGIVRDESRRAYLEVVSNLAAAGAEGVIFGCTEIGLLLRPDEVPLRVFDTTAIHAAAAVSYSLA